MSHNSSKSRKGGGQAGGASAAAATRSVAAQAVSAAAATRSDGDNHGDSVRDCDEEMDDGSDSDSSDGQFAGPRDREDIDSDSDREADNDGAGREAVSASTADDDVGSSRCPVEEIDSDAQRERCARVAWGAFVNEKRKDMYEAKMPDLVQHASVARDFVKRLCLDKQQLLLKSVQKLYYKKSAFKISKTNKMEKGVQLMDFFSNAGVIVREQERLRRVAGSAKMRKKNRKSQETGPAAQVRPMTADEWCRLIAIHFEPAYRSQMDMFWKKYGDRNIIDRSMDSEGKMTKFENTFPKIYFDQSAKFLPPAATLDDDNNVCAGVNPQSGSIDYNRTSQDLYLRWTQLRSECVCCGGCGSNSSGVYRCMSSSHVTACRGRVRRCAATPVKTAATTPMRATISKSGAAREISFQRRRRCRRCRRNCDERRSASCLMAHRDGP